MEIYFLFLSNYDFKIKINDSFIIKGDLRTSSVNIFKMRVNNIKTSSSINLDEQKELIYNYLKEKSKIFGLDLKNIEFWESNE